MITRNLRANMEASGALFKYWLTENEAAAPIIFRGHVVCPVLRDSWPFDWEFALLMGDHRRLMFDYDPYELLHAARNTILCHWPADDARDRCLAELDDLVQNLKDGSVTLICSGSPKSLDRAPALSK